MYKKLNHNERIIVDHAHYNIRGMCEGLANSMLMGYEWKAKQDDISEFEVFQDMEQKRNVMPVDESCSQSTPATLMESLSEHLEKYREACKAAGFAEEENIAASHYQRFFGDINALSTKQRKLRVLFLNSERYRRNALAPYVMRYNLTDFSDIAYIEKCLLHYHNEYSSLKTGPIGEGERSIDIFFGDRTKICGPNRKRRDDFFNIPEDRATTLKSFKLAEDTTNEEFKAYLENLG
jgi:hypothetical protein